jgi:signal transduction histidine kinase/CheY-like chemotaxis protein
LNFFKRSILIVAVFAIVHAITGHAAEVLNHSPINISAGLSFAFAALFGLYYLPIIFIAVIVHSSGFFLGEWDVYFFLLPITQGVLYGIAGYRFGEGWDKKFTQYSAVSLFAIGLGASFLFAVATHNLLKLQNLLHEDEIIQSFLSNWVDNFSGIMIAVPIVLIVHSFQSENHQKNISNLFHDFKNSTQISLIVSGVVLIALFSTFPELAEKAPYILFMVLIPILLISITFGVLNGIVSSLLMGITLNFFPGMIGEVAFDPLEIHFFVAISASISLIAGGFRNDRLVALNRAEIANRAKSDFLSSMSHELRTPMNAILGFGQLLEHNPKEPLSEKQREHTHHILKGGQHLLDLIDQVLELSKIEAGKVSLSVEKVRPTDVIKECLTMVSERAGENEIAFIDQTNKSVLPILRTDKNRFRQVLLNLLSNAVKYNRPGGSVTITSELVSDGFQRISVSDTGRGIPQNKRIGLFEPFNRLGLEAGEIEGTGIGLTITRELIELLGGILGYSSEENVGSTFWIELPLSEDQSSLKQEDVEKTDTAEIIKVGDNQSRTVLYIEDNPANMMLMKEIVGRLSNLTMLTALDAETGLDVAKNQLPDLILMDINLPGMDGVEALKKLRLVDKTKNIPVIALSAAAMPHEIQRGKEAGFEEYITKPINVAEILAAFKTHIG